jgi:hypothetical protein
VNTTSNPSGSYRQHIHPLQTAMSSSRHWHNTISSPSRISSRNLLPPSLTPSSSTALQRSTSKGHSCTRFRHLPMSRFIPPKLILFLSFHFILHYTHPLSHDWQLIAYLYLHSPVVFLFSSLFVVYSVALWCTYLCFSSQPGDACWRNYIT